MKRILLTLIFFSLTVSLLQSQVLLTIVFGDKLNSPTTEFGLNAGGSLSTFAGIDDIKYSASLTLGTFFTWKFHDRLQLQPEIYFILPAGAQNLPPFDIEDPDIEIPVNEMTVNREMNYFSLPILLKVQLFSQFRFSIGPQVSRLTSYEDYMYYSLDDTYDLVARKKDRSEINNWDFGITTGLGYKLGKGKGVNIEARFYYGLMDISTAPDLNLKNRIVTFQAGIPIRGFGKDE